MSSAAPAVVARIVLFRGCEKVSVFSKRIRRELHADEWASKYFTLQRFLARAVMPLSSMMRAFGPMNTGAV